MAKGLLGGDLSKTITDPAGLVKSGTGISLPGGNLFFGARGALGMGKSMLDKMAKPDMPEYGMTDQRGIPMMKKMYAEGKMGPEQIQQRAFEGVEEAGRGGLIDMSQEQQLQAARAGGLLPAGTQEAMAQTARRDVGKELARKKRAFSTEIPGIQMNLAGRGFDAVRQSYELNLQQHMRKRQAVMNKIAARNKAIAGLFSGLGMIGGALIGGPAGAQAGAQLGGNPAGPQQLT